jgi:hypothetical protein
MEGAADRDVRTVKRTSGGRSSGRAAEGDDLSCTDGFVFGLLVVRVSPMGLRARQHCRVCACTLVDYMCYHEMISLHESSSLTPLDGQ